MKPELRLLLAGVGHSPSPVYWAGASLKHFSLSFH